MLISLLQIFGGILTGVILTLLAQRGQTRLSERAHKHELERDSVTFQRQQIAKSRDWHAQQFDRALEAAKLYTECMREMNEPDDLKSQSVHDTRVKAAQLMTDVIHALSREPGNDYVIVKCTVVRGDFNYFEFLIEYGPFLGDEAESDDDEKGEDGDNGDVSEDWDSPSPRIRAQYAHVYASIRNLQSAIQDRLRELDAEMKHPV
jgi:hypothetical protein